MKAFVGRLFLPPELATDESLRRKGNPNVAAISAVFTIDHVAKLLGEDVGWLHELSINMFAEDGHLHVCGLGEVEVTAFTNDGIEYLKQMIADERPRRGERRS